MTVKIEGLSVRLGDRAALDHVSAEIGGGIVGVIGPNGAGKSTLLRTIAGLLAPSEGHVQIDGADIASLSPTRRARTIAYLPQGRTVHWPVSVERLVGLGRLPHLGPLSRLAPADQAAIEHALARTDLIALRDRPMNQLSGGEQARALLARAIAVEATILLADEPFAALDPRHQLQLQTIFRAEAQAGRTVLIVLHDLTTAARLCDRLLLLDRGRLIADGPPLDVLTARNLDLVYAIKAVILSKCDGPIILPVDLASRAP